MERKSVFTFSKKIEKILSNPNNIIIYIKMENLEKFIFEEFEGSPYKEFTLQEFINIVSENKKDIQNVEVYIRNKRILFVY
jgi:hypothetical protein